MNNLERMERFGKYSIPQVIVQIPERGFPKKREFDGVLVKMSSKRYKVFRNSHVCAGCGIEGRYFWLERNKNCADHMSPHFNLYAIDEQGNEVLMTKDHIVPKARGGDNSLRNLQTMCCRCNNKKGDMPQEEFDAKTGSV
jgi:5-methylcytosine-specific restriction endonuclease McrA